MHQRANELVRTLLGSDTTADTVTRRHADRTAFLACSVWSGSGDHDLLALRVLAQLHPLPVYDTSIADTADDPELVDALRRAEHNPTVRNLIRACCRFEEDTRSERLTSDQWDAALDGLIDSLPEIDHARIREAVERLT